MAGRALAAGTRLLVAIHSRSPRHGPAPRSLTDAGVCRAKLTISRGGVLHPTSSFFFALLTVEAGRETLLSLYVMYGSAPRRALAAGPDSHHDSHTCTSIIQMYSQSQVRAQLP